MRPPSNLLALALLSPLSPAAAAEPLRLNYKIKIEPAEMRVSVSGEMRGDRPEGAKGYASLGLRTSVMRSQDMMKLFLYASM